MRLCDRDIEAWLDQGRLSINPRPPVERINGATVDVRLGNKFRTFRGHTAAYIDLSGPKDEVSAALDRVMSDEIVLKDGEAFFLHPGELALAVTFESVTLPSDLVGWLDGRSSLARLGLMVRHRTPYRSGLVWLHRTGVLQLRKTTAGPASWHADWRIKLRTAFRSGGATLQPSSGCKVSRSAGRRCQPDR